MEQVNRAELIDKFYIAVSTASEEIVKSWLIAEELGCDNLEGVLERIEQGAIEKFNRYPVQECLPLGGER